MTQLVRDPLVKAAAIVQCIKTAIQGVRFPVYSLALHPCLELTDDGQRRLAFFAASRSAVRVLTAAA